MIQAILIAHLLFFSRYFGEPNMPNVDYPEGFQGIEIPVYGPTVAKLIEDRVAGLL